ncbi:hypothetical protein AB0J86_03760 [Micromonospora sp. NPDC049559]|uniref:hypothetical protein n=1 Tax=Micromonospora sp. NPDC049559 TaxID=3155923 RepID=UPI0034312058
MPGVSGHAYPWDVLGDPAFPGRVRDLGVDGVTLAAAYHSTRAATPLHPAHQTVDASHAALYRPVRPEVWDGRRLRPLAPAWLADPDPFGAAATTLDAAGLPVTAWIVLTHSTRLGTAYPDVAVTNCFGERYPYALCPAWAEVRDYATTLTAEALRDVPVAGVSLEACGQLGLAHLGHHEKTEGAWDADAARVLSICCCPACRDGWRARGLAPAGVLAALRAAVRADAGREPASASGAAGLDPALGAALLATRREATDALRAQVLAAVREHAPGVPVTLHAQPDPWATGPSPGLTPGAVRQVDALLVPAWPTTPASVDAVARAARTGAVVDAYVTVLPPAEPAAVVGHARRLVAAGARRLSLYHLGLAGRRRQALLADVVAALR